MDRSSIEQELAAIQTERQRRQAPTQEAAVPDLSQPVDDAFSFADSNAATRFGANFAFGLAESVLGLADLLGVVDDDIKEAMYGFDQALEGTGVAGFLGEAASYMVPFGAVAGAATRGVKALTGAQKLGRGAQLGVEMGAGAATGFTRLPGEFEDRGVNAAIEGVAGPLLGRAITSAGGAAISGFGRTEAAQAMLDRGVLPTLGKGSSNALINAAGFVSTLIPGLARGSIANRTAAGKQFAARAYADIVEGITGRQRNIDLTNPPELTDDMFTRLGDLISTGYKNAWSKAGTPTRQTVAQLKNVVDTSDVIDTNELKLLNSFVKQLDDFAEGRVETTPARLAAFDEKLVKNAGSKSYEAREAMKAMRQTLRANTNEAGLEALTRMDKNYVSYKMLNRAHKSAYRRKGADNTIRPSDMKDAIAGLSSDRSLAAGSANFKDFANFADDAISPGTGDDVIFSPWRRLMQKSPSLPESAFRQVDRIGFGQTKPQRTAQSALKRARAALERNNIDLTNYGITSGGIFNATTQ